MAQAVIKVFGEGENDNYLELFRDFKLLEDVKLVI